MNEQELTKTNLKTVGELLDFLKQFSTETQISVHGCPVFKIKAYIPNINTVLHHFPFISIVGHYE